MAAPQPAGAREARAQRAREIRDGVLNDQALVDQIRRSADPGAARIAWRELQAELQSHNAQNV